MKRKIGNLSVLLLALLALSGCSEAESDTDSSGNKIWKIVTDTSFKPFEYEDASGDLIGIDMDILDAIAKDQGFTYKIKAVGFDAAIADCQSGQADGMIAGVSITDERKGNGWIFSDGYYDANQSMAVAKSSSITGFGDMKGKSVAVKNGTMSADYAEGLAGEYDFIVTYFEDSPTMYEAVIDGEVDACFDDTPIMAANINDGDLDMKILTDTGNDPAEYGFAVFDKDNQKLVDLFNEGLANIKANGTYDEILKKYLGES